MKVKELDKTVQVAWSPEGLQEIMVATGTAAQQLDCTFNTNAALEIYSLNLTEPGLDLQLRSQTLSDNSFHKVEWGGGTDGDFSSGVVVGGCDNGHIPVYNAAKLLKGEDGTIALLDKHTGPVRALAFNKFQHNLLASGASNSEILIFDLKHLGTPMTPGAKSQPAENVLSIAWNEQVQHILASVFPQRCSVWDLRKNSPIIKITDANPRVRWKEVAWHPQVATQLCLASEEDEAPVVQLWDLRFATSPVKVMVHHRRGVLSIAWSRHDPNMLLSCGKDQSVVCWNPNSDQPGGEILCEFAAGGQWNYDVSWCPRNPAIMACASSDAKFSVHSLMGGQSQAQTSNKIADSFPGMDPYAQAPASQQQQQVSIHLKKAPQWLMRPCRASFAFGGKLVQFGVGSPREVTVSQVVTERSLVDRVGQFEAAVAAGSEAMAYFCLARAGEAPTASKKAAWECVHAGFCADPRTQLVGTLGFSQETLNEKLKMIKPANAHSDEKFITDGIENLRNGDAGDDVSDTGADFDDFLLDPTAQPRAAAVSAKATPEKDQYQIKVGNDVSGLISCALLLGNTEAAVDLCLEHERYADAIILAMTGGPDLLARTQFQYFQRTQDGLNSLISAVVTEDWTQVVRSCSIGSWKEALAAIITHANNNDLPALCDQLGQRLEHEAVPPQLFNAALCYICATSIDKLMDCWPTSFDISSPEQLQELVELVILVRKLAEGQGRDLRVSDKLDELLARYAALLASQGLLDTALSFLGTAQSSANGLGVAATNNRMAQLHDRLYRTLGRAPAHQQQPQQTRGQARTARLSQSSNSFHPEPRRLSSGYAPTSAPTYSPASMFTPAPVQPSTPAFASAYAPAQPPPVGATSYLNPAVNAASPTPVPAFHNANPAGTVGTYRSYQSREQNLLENSWIPAPIQTPQWSGPSTTSRGKYVVDPSVASSPYGAAAPMANPYAPAPVSAPLAQPTLFTPGASTAQAGYGHAAFGHDAYANDSSRSSGNGTPQPPPLSNAPPGWNDPPMVKNAARNQYAPVEGNEMSARHAGTRKWQRMINHAHDAAEPTTEYVAQDPITHPLFATGAPENHANVPGAYGAYNPGQQFPGQTDHYQPAAHGYQPSPQQGYQPAPQQGYQHAAQQGYQHAQQQSYQPTLQQGYQPDPQQGYQAQHAAPAAPVAKVAEPPKPKAAIPEEHMHLQTVFNELQSRCAAAASNPQTRRKLEDVCRKLEMLYDCLRDSKLSPSTLQGLHEIVQLVQTGNYTHGLELHTRLVSGADFAQIAGFMPGLKVLLQTALQLGVYLQ